MARNITQVVGVFGQVDTTEDGFFNSYKSSMRLENLRNLADMIENLRSPPWPESIFGEIDKSENSDWAHGRDLFKKYCVSCHEIVKRDEPQRRIDVHLTKLRNVRTDPLTVRNFLNRKVDPGVLEGRGLKEKNEATGNVPRNVEKGMAALPALSL
jgi:hypothetical protein